MANSLLKEITENGRLFIDSKDDVARQRTIAAASALIQELENPGEQMARIGWAEPALVARTLKHLAANGIVKEVGIDQYVGTSFSMATNDPTISAGLIYSFEGMIPTFQGLPEFLAKTKYQAPMDGNNGPVQYGLKTNKPFFGVLRDNPRLGSAFNDFMTGYAKARPRWVDFYPAAERLGSGSTSEQTRVLLVDVGGGVGHEILEMHKKHPNLPGQLILQDQPSVIDQANASGNLPGAITAVAHDFFEPQPVEYHGARAYFMRLILHDWPDAKCAIILSHLRNAMVKGYSKLLINEAVLRDTGAPWQQTSLDWTMMGMLVSRERTESQWRELLAGAGLKISGIWHKDAESVIEAVLE
ncbi:S-adenosyl-L-methionine-dependent methyltransferase [Xylariaceae sp. FL1651]|nr:S-adenosyl-L-methionine-dependent methyltransferase [Xylariaceae sp. FL1651]